MCSLVPSVTLYGTTQIKTDQVVTETITATYLGEPQIITRKAGKIDTITPTSTEITTRVNTKATIVTKVIPQQTLYYPCTTTDKLGNVSQPTLSSSTDLEMAETSNLAVDLPSSTTLSLLNTSVGQTGATHSESQKLLSTGTSSVLSQKPVSQPANTTSSSSTPNPTLDTSSAPISSAGSSSSTEDGPDGGMIAGIVVGVLIGLILLCVALAWLRRSRNKASDGGSIGPLDYWERKFKDLEADEGGMRGDRISAAKGDESERSIASKRLRLTLDLQSKGMNPRPASRLSAISSFFAKPQPLPFRHNTSKSGQTLNFSRPRFGASSSSDRNSHSDRSDASHRANGSLRSLSTWLGLKTDAEQTASLVRPRMTSISPPGWRRGAEGEESSERKGMEWIRGNDLPNSTSNEKGFGTVILSVENHEGYSLTAEDIGKAENHLPRGDSPILGAVLAASRSVGSPVTSRWESREGSTAVDSNPTPTRGLGRQLTPPRPVLQYSSPFSSTWITSPPPPPRQQLQHQNTPPQCSRNFSTPPAYPDDLEQPHREKRVKSKSKLVPELHLSRDAITPSLWIDEETYEQFQRHQNANCIDSTNQGQRSTFSPYSLDSSTLSASDCVDTYGGIENCALASSSTTDSFGTSLPHYPPQTLCVRGERSAVTPQLPIVQLDTTRIGWEGATQLEEGEERVVSIYQQPDL